jgi:D-3-phosphoglycerate dehydrogenase / 2-oxoglutarate reductase
MANFRILVTDGLAQAGLDMLAEVGEVVSNPKITPEEVIAALPEFDALIVRSRTKVKANMIAAAGDRLKVIGRAGVGVDNIDVAAALAKGLTVVNSPLAATAAVAEHAIGMMLGLARLIPMADASMKAGKWEKSAFMGAELAGKTLGLLGIGRIGAATAKLAAGFGMKVIAYDPMFDGAEIQKRGAQPASFEDVLKKADYVSLHLPLSEKTKNLIGAEQIAMMKPGARLVCTARGGVVDEVALCAALDSGQLSSAALDVFASEPPQPGSIAEHPKVIATPHVGAQTKEAQTRAGVSIAEEVIRALKGEELRWRVLAND